MPVIKVLLPCISDRLIQKGSFTLESYLPSAAGRRCRDTTRNFCTAIFFWAAGVRPRCRGRRRPRPLEASGREESGNDVTNRVRPHCQQHSPKWTGGW